MERDSPSSGGDVLGSDWWDKELMDSCVKLKDFVFIDVSGYVEKLDGLVSLDIMIIPRNLLG